MNRKTLTGFGLIAALLAAVHAFWCVLVPTLSGSLRLVEIKAGMSVREIAAHLEEARVIRSRFYFHLLARVRGNLLKAGEYGFRNESALGALGKLERGDIYLHRVLVPEGVTVAWIADFLAAEKLVDREEFKSAVSDSKLLKKLGVKARSAEGYLFPDTYRIPRGVKGGALVSIMVGRFFDNLPEDAVKLAAKRGLSLSNLVTLASIVEKEAVVSEERPVISGVFHRRLKRGMLLQADPTVRYALRKWERRLTYRDLKVDSRYNTYRYGGLPPGPICSPGRSSLEAAARPKKVPYLYFVARWDGTGRHDFSRTFEEHERAKRSARARVREAGR